MSVKSTELTIQKLVECKQKKVWQNFKPANPEEYENAPKKVRARWHNGIPLEFLIQSAHRRQKISFKGNPLDKTYPFSYGLDVETWYSLYELTNPKSKTWMNDEVMNEKIDRFPIADPKHEKTWVIITSYANWSKAIMQRIQRLGFILIILKRHITRRHRMEELVAYVGGLIQKINDDARENAFKLKIQRQDKLNKIKHIAKDKINQTNSEGSCNIYRYNSFEVWMPSKRGFSLFFPKNS